MGTPPFSYSNRLQTSPSQIDGEPRFHRYRTACAVRTPCRAQGPLPSRRSLLSFAGFVVLQSATTGPVIADTVTAGGGQIPILPAQNPDIVDPAQPPVISETPPSKSAEEPAEYNPAKEIDDMLRSRKYLRNRRNPLSIDAEKILAPDSTDSVEGLTEGGDVSPVPLESFKLTEEAEKRLLEEEEIRRRNQQKASGRRGRIRELEETRAELAEKQITLLLKEKELLEKEQTLRVLREELELERKLRALLTKEKEKAEEEAALAMGLCSGANLLP
ncbi:hypothetical protein BSKO_03045 [Bryopsis sp. KO-2023]|nr:hypothetical protein BSKO_03045 [Bryopsis sp. KO-2023]